MKTLKMIHLLGAGLLGFLLLGGCDNAADKDTQPPEILSAGDATCPLNCQEFERGDVIPFAYSFRDNVALGAYNLEIHHNFDHHTHSTEAGECRQDASKTPVNPWIYNKDFTIPSAAASYDAVVKIPVPTDIDPGEYHFMIRLTDQSGWQQIRSMSIRIN